MLNRHIAKYILKFAKKKIILLTGPRQSGKTTLVKHLSDHSIAYYNYDESRSRKVFKEKAWDMESDIVIFDELHKMKNWKTWLKGIYDSEHLKKQIIIVTGSARLDISKRMGDSLAGRYFSYSLHPLDLKELRYAYGKRMNTEKFYHKLISISNFPEPFLDGTQAFYKQWKKGHSDIIVRQDLITLEKIRDIDGVLLLIDLLSKRVGSTISYNSLAEDLDRDDKTIKKWITILENFYIGFKLEPYSKNIARAKKKAFKFYFYDLGRVDGDESQKLENLVALGIKKELDFINETQGEEGSMNFVQTDKNNEIDFLVQIKNNQSWLIEVKLSSDNVSKSFALFEKYFKDARKVQLVKNLDRSFNTQANVRVTKALEFMENLNFLA